ncbi:MAG TPA: choice-of-anchor B family protein [Steroidobacteraceae bacterium]|nr:choice-of-anchor B family protein [Steroidobacteraceae bacterium]
MASLWLATAALAHDDLDGTRFVAPAGIDSGDCDEREAPCRTLTYALTQSQPGDAIEFGAGTYDLSGADLESIAFGKYGIRGGYSTADGFRQQDADANITRLLGVDPKYLSSLAAHGFLLVDTAGQPIAAAPPNKLAAPTTCINGFAGSFPCRNVDFLAQVTLAEFSSRPTSGSNVWGFVDRNDNREYAVMGHRNGTTVFDVTTPAAPREVGTIDGVASLWREVKILQLQDAATGRFKAYAYVSTEGTDGGLQVLDLTDLPNTVRLANTLRDISRAHTVYVGNVEYAGNTPLPGRQPYLVVAGSNLDGGALRLYDLADPSTPRLTSAAPPGAEYMHDSTSFVITDNRTTQCAAAHNPCELLIDFNENQVEIWDVTDKAAPTRLSRTGYPNATYVHSGWWTEDKRYVIVHDELEELRRGLNTQMYTLDLADLRAPTVTTSYSGPETATDHNGYALGNRYYVSHYKRGLVIFDISNPLSLSEVASFDTYLTPAANSAGTDGAWGAYPYLPSGTILLSDIENGLFLLKLNETSAVTPPAPVAPPTPAPAPTPIAAPGGGGGAIDLAWLMLLALLVWRQAHRKRAPRTGT